MANIAKDLAQIISQSNSKKTGPYDTPAKVKRIEGNTVWVSIPGGIDETPIGKTVNCSVGDNVQVRVSGGRAWITGNATAPPTDDTTAIKADTTANKAQVIAVDAKETAEAVEGIAVNASTTASSAMTIAEGVNEHFWHDSGGAHVTEVTQEEWNDSTDPNYHSGGNTLITTQGMAIRNGLTNLAQFGSTGAVIGEVTNGNSRTEIGTSGMQIYQRDSGNDISIANLGYGPGINSGGGTSDAPYYTLGTRASGPAVGNYSVAEGTNTEASGYNSHAEGESTIASGYAAHAEGMSTESSSVESHAEGYATVASGGYSHAEGENTEASGDEAHAEGLGTKATADATHAANVWTVADQFGQTAIGRYNTKNNTNNLFVIGNGTADNARSDAFQVDSSGNVIAAGSVSANGHPVGTMDTFVVSSHTTSNTTVNGGSTMTATTQTFTKAGYYPLAIAGWVLNGSNATNLTLVHLYISSQSDGSVDITYRIHNAGSSNSTSTNVRVYILWIKS